MGYYGEVSDSQMELARETKQVFNEKCKSIQNVLEQDDLKKARTLIMKLLREEYGDLAVDTWALRYFIQIEDGVASTPFEHVIEEYLKKESARFTYHGSEALDKTPPVLSLLEATTFRDIYDTIKKTMPEANKEMVLTYIASKTLEDMA